MERRRREKKGKNPNSIKNCEFKRKGGRRKKTKTKGKTGIGKGARRKGKSLKETRFDRRLNINTNRLFITAWVVPRRVFPLFFSIF